MKSVSTHKHNLSLTLVHIGLLFILSGCFHYATVAEKCDAIKVHPSECHIANDNVMSELRKIHFEQACSMFKEASKLEADIFSDQDNCTSIKRLISDNMSNIQCDDNSKRQCSNNYANEIRQYISEIKHNLSCLLSLKNSYKVENYLLELHQLASYCETEGLISDISVKSKNVKQAFLAAYRDDNRYYEYEKDIEFMIDKKNKDILNTFNKNNISPICLSAAMCLAIEEDGLEYTKYEKDLYSYLIESIDIDKVIKNPLQKELNCDNANHDRYLKKVCDYHEPVFVADYYLNILNSLDIVEDNNLKIRYKIIDYLYRIGKPNVEGTQNVNILSKIRRYKEQDNDYMIPMIIYDHLMGEPMYSKKYLLQKDGFQNIRDQRLETSLDSIKKSLTLIGGNLPGQTCSTTQPIAIFLNNQISLAEINQLFSTIQDNLTKLNATVNQSKTYIFKRNGQ